MHSLQATIHEQHTKQFVRGVEDMSGIVGCNFGSFRGQWARVLQNSQHIAVYGTSIGARMIQLRTFSKILEIDANVTVMAILLISPKTETHGGIIMSWLLCNRS